MSVVLMSEPVTTAVITDPCGGRHRCSQPTRIVQRESGLYDVEVAGSGEWLVLSDSHLVIDDDDFWTWFDTELRP